jgi:hypothetical protein
MCGLSKTPFSDYFSSIGLTEQCEMEGSKRL